MDVNEALAVAADPENYDSADQPKAARVLATEVQSLRADLEQVRALATPPRFEGEPGDWCDIVVPAGTILRILDGEAR